ncbi:hypothetical protein AAG570_005022 [Ranatra chinensis]|uniref:Uncharacterized protein n=1 Tax=Ranatra chinensis TaxID=642074 RepID=A0ABD0Y0V7_9HEMI
MGSKRPNMFHKNETQETTENGRLACGRVGLINLGAAVGVQPPRYNAEQRSNDDDSADEFLTGAHSQNLAASAFNNRVNGEQKRTGYNTSVSAAYAFNTTPAPLPSKRTEKPRPFTTTQQPPQVKTQEGRHDPTAYDYAYYDDGTPSEYENVENVEEFSRTTARKRSA